MENNNWTQVDIFTTTQGLEPLGAALMEIGINSFAIQDAADFESLLAGKNGRWDYIDDDLMKLREAETTVTVYLPDNRQGGENLAAVRQMLDRLKALDGSGEWGRLEYALSGVREEDWAFAWKKYYTPMKIGEKLVVCPSWEEYAPAPGEIVLQMDPGMAFGTGTHDSTRLCLQFLEDRVKGGEAVLDVGCGSGILAISALLLGAERALGVDIDEVAVRSSQENALRNGVENRARFIQGSLAQDVEGRFDIVCANIVADIIIAFGPEVPSYLKPDGVFLVSGIIDARTEDVLEALTACGFSLLEKRESGGWAAMLFSLK